jgi:uncharacterized membrane protein
MFRTLLRWLLAALFLFAGTVHLADSSLFLPIMPPWIPLHVLCIQISGVCELMGGIGLLITHPLVQLATGWGLLALLLAVFPANIYMAVNHIKVHGIPASPWAAWARLPLQPILMLAVSWVAGIWPKPR